MEGGFIAGLSALDAISFKEEGGPDILPTKWTLTDWFSSFELV